MDTTENCQASINMIVDDHAPPAEMTPENYLATGKYAENELIDKILKHNRYLTDGLPDYVSPARVLAAALNRNFYQIKYSKNGALENTREQ